jgi:hypothetical protein
MKAFSIGIVPAVWALLFAASARAQQQPPDFPQYRDGRELVLPGDYRQWTFLSTGLGMTYNMPRATPLFSNIFVTPSSYRGFLETGTWPDGTIFMLEARKAVTEGSINKGGQFQTDIVALEAHVKDARLPRGWGFFSFGSAPEIKTTGTELVGEGVERCVTCHVDNGAVEETFVQFYPAALEAARKKGTLRSGF